MDYQICASCEPLPVQVFREALSHPVLGPMRLAFPDQRLIVDAPAFSRVLRAVVDQRVPLALNRSMPQRAAARYMFTEDRIETNKPIWSLSHAIHEAVHVLQDEARVRGARAEVEAVAYAVDFIYRRRLMRYWNSRPVDPVVRSLSALEGASPFRDALESLISQRDLVRHPRGTLTRQDLEPVAQSIVAYYEGTARMVFDGVDLR